MSISSSEIQTLTEHQLHTPSFADQIAFDLAASDKLQIAWGGTVSQGRGACPAYFGGDKSYWIVFVNKGMLHLKVNDEPINVSKGQTLIVLPQEICVGSEPLKANTQWQWIAFRVVRVGRRSKSVAVQVARSITAEEPAMIAEIFRFITEEFHSKLSRVRNQECLSTLGAHAMMLSLLARLDPRETGSQHIPTSPTLIAERAKDYVRIHLHEPIQASDVAQALQCSPGYLSAAFTKTYAETLSKYIIGTKLRLTRGEIANTGKPIGEIAHQFGFTSLNYFTRAFKRHFGMSPREYRNLYSHRYITTDI